MRKFVLTLLVFYLFAGSSFLDAQEFTTDEQFARDEAIRDAQKLSIEEEKAAAELEEMRLESEGNSMRDQEQMQRETDSMRRELAEELATLYREVEMEAELSRETLEREEAQALKQALEDLNKANEDLGREIKRIRLRPPRP